MRAEEFVSEKWSEKYKRSINCSNPKGFSQRAHCQGRNKHNEDIQIDERTADYVRTVMNAAADEMKSHGYRAVGQLDIEDLESVARRAGTSLHDVQIILGMDRTGLHSASLPSPLLLAYPNGALCHNAFQV